MKKILAILLAASISLCLSQTAAAEASLPDLSGTLVILHTNDTHGRDVALPGESIGTAGIAQLKKDYEAAGADVLLLSAGDAFQGTSLVNNQKGELAIGFMNAAGYDAMTPGNHEFDWGADHFYEIVQNADFPVLSANIVDTNGELIYTDSVMLETRSGLKVGVFGLTTPETATSTDPQKISGIRFLSGEALYAAAQAQVDSLTESGADLIIALGHLGTTGSANGSHDVIAHVEGIDLFIDGHTHTVLENGEAVGDTLLVSAGEHLQYAGVVTYTAEGGFTAELVSAKAYSKTDERVAALINTENDRIDELLSAVFAESEIYLDGDRTSVRSGETNLGDFAADSMYYTAAAYFGENNVDAAIINGGGIRASIEAGPVTMKDLTTVFPYGNEIVLITITGEKLLEALEASLASLPEETAAFPHVSGMSYTIDTREEFIPGDYYDGGSSYQKPQNPGARVKDVKIGGQPLELDREYRIATINFLANGGDSYGAFKESPALLSGIIDDEAMIQYVGDTLGGVIPTALYAEAAGRITILTPEDEITVSEPEDEASENPKTGAENLYLIEIFALCAVIFLALSVKKSSVNS